MQTEFLTNNSLETQKLGEMLAMELRGGEIICLSGDLGAGKTTFAQGLLKGLGATGPYTSPTFVIMKEYKKKISNFKFQISNKLKNSNNKIQSIYHIDAYRVGEEDIESLGWEEIIADKRNVIIVEWAERISGIIPKGSLWIEFEGVDEEKRRITFRPKF